jgi:hypothetical protein
MSSQRRGSLLRYDCTITPPLTPISNHRCTPPPLQSDPVEAIKPKRKCGRPPKSKANLDFSPTTTTDAYTPGVADHVDSPPCETIDPRLLEITSFSNDYTAPYFNSDIIEFNDIEWTSPSPPLDTSLNVQQLQNPSPGFNTDVSYMQVYDAGAISPKSAVPQLQPQPQPLPQPQQILDDYHVVSATKAAILGTSDLAGTVSHQISMSVTQQRANLRAQELAPAVFGPRFKQEHACIFSVVTARDLHRDQITVALIAYTEHDCSRWVKVARGDQYWESLQLAMTILLASLEGLMAGMLRNCIFPARI